MSEEALVGIDLGTTALKVAAFDRVTGKALAQASERLPVRVGRDGARDQAPVTIVRLFRRVCGRVVSQIGSRARRVVGVGLAAQGGSSVIADRETGRAHTPLILWTDKRSMKESAEIARRRPVSYWRRRTLRDSAGHGLGRFLWFRKTRPDLLVEQNIHAGAGDYLYFRLTGLWRQDPCHALQIGGYNAARRRLDQGILDIVGLPLSFLPPLRNGHEVNPLSRAGARLTGLPEGIPVAGPYIDQEAGYLSAAAAGDRPLQCSLGTAWVGNFSLPEDARWSSPTQLVLPAVKGSGWLVCHPLATGNIAWDWALARFLDRDHARALAKAERVFARDLLPPEGLTAAPLLNSGNPLFRDALGAGCFFGVNAQTEPEDLVRAMAVSLASEMARVFDALRTRREVERALIGGGAAKGRFFRTLLAGLFQPLPVYHILDGDLAGPRGALHVFGRGPSAVRVRRIPRPRGRLAKRIFQARDNYLALLERLYRGALEGQIVFRD